MPCYTEPHAYCDHDNTEEAGYICNLKDSLKSLLKRLENYEESNKDQKKYYEKRANEATRLLCGLMKHLTQPNCNKIEISAETVSWYEKHKEWDKQILESLEDKK